MKKSEIYLFFATLLIGLSILLIALFNFIKPTKTQIVYEQQTNTDIDIKPKSSDSWIDKMSNQSREFSYPSVIYKLKF